MLHPIGPPGPVRDPQRPQRNAQAAPPRNACRSPPLPPNTIDPAPAGPGTGRSTPATMKIVHYLFSTDQRLGGPVRAVSDLCLLLAKGGNDVSLVTSIPTDAPTGWTGADRTPRLVVVPPPARPGKVFSKPQVAAMRPLIAGADALHLHGIWELFNIQLAKTATAAGVPYFISTRGMLDEYCFDHRGFKKRVYMALFARRWLAGARRIHCTADEELRQSQRFFPAGRGVVIPNLMDLAPFADPPGPDLARQKFPFLPAPRPVAVFLGRLHPIKGIDRLLDAAKILFDRGKPFDIVLAGPPESADYDRQLREQAQRLGLADSVHFVGMVSGPAKLSLLRACDLFVQPSHHENFGMSLVEALACALPVVTTHGVKIWPELERSGGAVITSAEPEPFAAALESVLFDRSRLQDMGRRGRAWVMDFLDADRVRAQYEAMYAAPAA